MYIKVKNHDNLVRDSESKAILNTDVAAYNAFIRKKKMDQEHNDVVNKIQKLETDISEIKNMISSLINK